MTFWQFAKDTWCITVPVLVICASILIAETAYRKGHKAGRQSVDQEAFVKVYKEQMKRIYGEVR